MQNAHSILECVIISLNLYSKEDNIGYVIPDFYQILIYPHFALASISMTEAPVLNERALSWGRCVRNFMFATDIGFRNEKEEKNANSPCNFDVMM